MSHGTGPGTAEVSHRTKPMPLADGQGQELDERPKLSEAAPGNGPGPDPLTAIAIQTLSQAVEMLRGDVEHERDRADRAEREVEVGRLNEAPR